MALSNKKILEYLETGDIVIEPFNESQLQTSSYDVRLGEYYYRKNPLSFAHKMYSPYSKKDIDEMWGSPQEAITADESFHNIGQSIPDGLNKNDLVIILGPGEHILGHTDEYIGGRNVITTHMQARSSVGRQDIVVCRDAGWGDVGYFNRWTMEIGNDNPHRPTVLVVGTRVAQIVFEYTGQIVGKDYLGKGHYQNFDDVDFLKATWFPEMMLPKPLDKK